MTETIDYRAAGVNIDAGNQLVGHIKSMAKATHSPQVLSSIGGFASLFAIDKNQYQNPVLVSATDGVGTKLKLAIELGLHSTIGIDLVAMSVNDLIVCGAKPLFFLDYFATGQLDVETARTVIQGICDGCQQADTALVGGETAEMPGIYQAKDYDLAGFCVGIVEKNEIITGKNVQPGDILLGIHSSGPHSNGYSLIRHILNKQSQPLDTPFANSTLGEHLIQPTKIYVKSILGLLQKISIHAMAHITGGGILENLPRVLPESCQAIINTQAWKWPEIFHWLQQQGNINTQEMYRTFNCGIGMILCLHPNDVDTAIANLEANKEKVTIIGHIDQRTHDQALILL
jgi:phosphoribosylformylglycinamidine cyclo-ligase